MRSVLGSTKARVAPKIARSANAASQTTLSPRLMLAGLLVAGLLLRLLLISAEGFHGDVSSFEAWSNRLVDTPVSQFYSNDYFADYPPGYLYVLYIVGHLYRFFIHDDASGFFFKCFVKMPAILCDLVNAALVFRIVRKFASQPWAFAAAALVALNPSAIFISAYWGQVDSVAASLTLLSLLLMVDAYGESGRRATVSITLAWLALSASVLMKPPAVVIAPLYLVFAFTSPDHKVRVTRLLATWYGLFAGLILAFVSAIPFHPGFNPIAQYAWLISRYAYGANVYPYNSINAFNLYAMFLNSKFWQSDTGILPGWYVGSHTIGLPQYVWGIVIFVAALLLVVSRFVQRREPVAILEAAMILSLGYFVLSTRMHERYVFNAMLLTIPLIFYRRRYIFAAVILTLTLFGNLYYSLDYLHVMDAKLTADYDMADMHPVLSHFSSFLNVATFFYLGYAFLGTGEDVLQDFNFPALGARLATGLRHWFSPREGVIAMTLQDWAIASGLAVSSFVLSFLDYTWPSEKIFDEIYYARAGEEYLTHKEIFEFTHPPLTKLWITLSMILFGGMHGLGDHAAGWRFLNLVMGAFMVFVIYVFAKRLLGSTPFATIAACLLLFDGFHYVQSRIATPEITVAFFTLLTLYAFYRFWLASQVRVVAKFTTAGLRAQGIALAVGLIISGVISAVVSSGQDATTHVVAFLFVGSGFYAAVRIFVPRFVRSRSMTSYADGSRVVDGVLRTLDGGVVPLDKGAIVAGESTALAKDGTLVHSDGDLRITYGRAGKVTYATPEGTATFTPEGTMQVDTAKVDGTRDGLIWLVVLAISAGCLGSSKWNGLFDFFVVWGLAIAVACQSLWAPALRAIGLNKTIAQPATWGNPFGISVDILVTTMLFIGGSIYILCYIPYFSLGHNFGDLVGLQKQMFGYHYDLTATHPYGSKWWQWPILQRPISYYYHDFRVGSATQDPTACCVAEILALPNPLNWWTGLFSVPFIAYLAVREKNKGYLLLVVAYFLQWLPWILSPRVAFEYHFFPNLAIICLANAVLLQRVWRMGEAYATKWSWPRYFVAGYCTSIVLVFAFFFPILVGFHVPWNVWDARMLHWLMGYHWV